MGRAIELSDHRKDDSGSGVHLACLDLAGRELVELDILEVSVELALRLELAGQADRLDAAVVEYNHL